MPASADLKRKLEQFCQTLFTTYKRSNKLPATIIGAEYNNIKKVDRSGKVPDPLSSKLLRTLTTIAPLGTKGFDNFVGCCCEVRTSNQILLVRPTVRIEQIIFTPAKRPRTRQIIRRCANCKHVFG